MNENTKWMIYGATGVTGRLAARRAVQQGLRPVLAGRSSTKLEELGREFDLEWLSFDLNHKGELQKALRGVGLVLNLAGPFARTAPLMVEACLETGTHYLDIANELESFQALLAYDQAAKEKAIAVLPGVGFGTVATNFLAKKVADQVPEATHLEAAVSAYNAYSSPGTAGTVLEVLAGGGRIFERGQLKPYRLGGGVKRLLFPGHDQESAIMPVPVGDLLAAHKATGIENVRVYSPLSGGALSRLMLPIVQGLLRFTPVRNLAMGLANRRSGKNQPAEKSIQPQHSYAWASARNARGQKVEGWLELGEGYQFTAMSSVKAATIVLERNLSGVMFPAQAFNADFLTELEGVRYLNGHAE